MRSNAVLGAGDGGGKVRGRPKSDSESVEARIRERLAQRESVRVLATELGTSRMTVMRIRDAMAA